MRRLPTGTVTFLFADVEGSTALQQDPQLDYAEAIALLRRLLRDGQIKIIGAMYDVCTGLVDFFDSTP